MQRTNNMADNQSGGAPKKRGNRRPNNNNNNNRRKPRRNYRGKPKQKPLTWWQKLLKFFGIDVTKKSKGKPQGQTNKPASKKAPSKTRGPKKEKSFQPTNTDELSTKRLYVGNLSYEATEFELEDLFKGIGPVREVEVIYNRHTHRSKGYAFVSMGTIEDSKRAIEVLHNQPFMGRNLNISGAKERQASEEQKAEA